MKTHALIIISLILQIGFFSYSAKGQEIKSNNGQLIPCKECITFSGVQSSRFNSYLKQTYYTYRYFNQCSRDIKICWDCENTGRGCRTIKAGKYKDFEYPCGQSGLQNLEIICTQPTNSSLRSKPLVLLKNQKKK